MKNSNKSLLVLLYTETQELFGRFGITALLVLYLTHQLNMSDSRAFTIYSIFIASIYVTPLVGGYLADRYLGHKNAIIIGGTIMAIGNIFLVYPGIQMVEIGLFIIALGSGLFTSSLAALLGKLYADKEHKRESGFTIYYICKNIGALLAPILCGIIAHYYNFNYAFILSAIAMLSGVVVFINGKKHLPQENIMIKNSSFTAPRLKSSKQKKQLVFVLSLTLFVVIFSTCLGQGGTTLNLFIDRLVDRNIFNFIIPTSFFYTLDPLFMIMLGPLLIGFFIFMKSKNRAISTIGKFTLAMFFLALGFVIFIIAGIVAQHYGKSSMLFIVAAYFVFPTAELCIMPIGLAAVTRYASKNMQAMMVGVFMLGQACAGYLTGLISKLGDINFPVNDFSGLQHAAKIYLHLFTVTATILLITGALLLLLKPYLYLLTENKSDSLDADELATCATIVET